MPTRRQHYVWRHYLEAWQADNLVASLIGNTLTRTKPANIMVQRDFYRLGTITSADVDTLHALLLRNETAPTLRNLHRDLIDKFRRLSAVNAVVQAIPHLPSEYKDRVRNSLIDAEEHIHSRIEQRAVPILAALRSEDPHVIDDPDTSVDFYNFISHQYLRTKALRDAIANGLRTFLPADVAERIHHVYCHCIATNVGATLFRDRSDFELLFLRPPTPNSLITGDQPVVNLLATHDGTEPSELALYYPLTPSLAMILSPRYLHLRQPVATVTEPSARELNDLIAWKSARFLVAHSQDLLRPYTRPATAPPPSPLTLLPMVNPQAGHVAVPVVGLDDPGASPGFGSSSW